MKSNKNFEWVFHKNQLTLVSSTLYNNKNFSYKHENLFYYIWDPHSSKLAAAIFNGLEIFPFINNSKILYVTDFPNYTSIHLSNLVGTDGIIFLNEEKKSSNSSINKSISQLKNLKIIDNMESFNILQELDVILIDVNFNFSKEFFATITNFLKKNAFIFLIQKTELVNEKDNILKEEFFTKYDIIQKINLTDFFKDLTMIIAKKL